MILYPAIDLIDGKCVRLFKGDFEQKTTYDVSPFEVLETYKAEGAEWVHIVDLDGAKDSKNRQSDLMREISNESGLKIQTGGGIRSANLAQIKFVLRWMCCRKRINFMLPYMAGKKVVMFCWKTSLKIIRVLD